MLQFETLKIHGFAGQVEFLAFKLNRPGLNIITGRNGSNKSTIFNALSWVLYGETLKIGASVETWEHKQPSDYSGTMVQVSFVKDGTRFKIIRCKKYKEQVGGLMGRDRLVLEQNGESYKVRGVELKDKRDIQKAITTILGMSYKLFINTVIFPQRITRFIEESGSEKKRILEESFNLQWINQALVLAKNRLEKAQQVMTQQIKVIKNIEDQIKGKKDMIADIEADKVKFEKNKSQAIADIQAQIEELETLPKADEKVWNTLIKQEAQDEARLSLLQNDSLIVTKAQTLTKINSWLAKKSAALTKVDFAKKHIAAAKDGICDACGQVLEGKSAKEHRRKYLAMKAEWEPKYQEAVDALRPLETDYLAATPIEKEIQELEARLKTTRKSLRDEEPLRLKAANAQGRISELKTKKEEKAKETFNDVSKPILRGIFEDEKKLKAETKELKRIKRTADMLTWVIKDPLSNSGLKAFLFDKLLKTLNDRIQYYERFTSLGIELEVDMDGARKDINTIVTKEGYPVNYKDLSGGESQSVNVTVALGTSDILTQDNPTNLQVLDEVFEGLDPNNVDIVGSLLSDRANEKSLFVITHNSSFNPRNATIITMEDGD